MVLPGYIYKKYASTTRLKIIKKEIVLIRCSRNKLEEERAIDVKQIDDEDFEVIVSSDFMTHHKVKVTDIAYYK